MEDKTLATPSNEEMEAQEFNELEDANDTQTEVEENNTEENLSYDDIWNDDEISLEDLNSKNTGEEDGMQEETEENETEEENEEIEETYEQYEEPTDETDEEDDTIGSNEDKKRIVVTKPLKYRGKEIWVNNEDELIELAQKGLDYSFKMSKIKPHRRIVDLIENAGLTEEDIVALADAKNGKSEAIKYLQEKFNLEPTDDLFDDEIDYKPEVKQQNHIEEVFNDIQQRDPELAGLVVSVWNNQVPDEFKREIAEAELFADFVGSIQTGEFDRVFPELIKLKSMDRYAHVKWLDLYRAIANDLLSQRQLTEPMQKNIKRKPKRQIKRKKVSYDELWDKDLNELEKELFKK